MENTKVVHKSTSTEEMAEELVENFARLLRQLEENGKEADEKTFLNYLAGATSALMVMGFGKDGTQAVVDRVHVLIDDIVGEGCGECDACKRRKELGEK